ncbi:MAG: sporulation initiation factor Spo0A C-terminal domain-containing protein [Evtepia sp.]
MEMVLTEIYDLLYRLGITANYTGFFHMGYAVKLCCERPERLLMVTKWVYPEVAKHYQTNGRAVERNIRTVGKVLGSKTVRRWSSWPGVPSDKPGNAQLLAMLSHCLLVQLASEAACSVEGRR